MPLLSFTPERHTTSSTRATWRIPAIRLYEPTWWETLLQDIAPQRNGLIRVPLAFPFLIPSVTWGAIPCGQTGTEMPTVPCSGNFRSASDSGLNSGLRYLTSPTVLFSPLPETL